MHRSLRFAASFIATPFALLLAGTVGTADSTRCNGPTPASEPKTLLNGLGVSAVHYDLTTSVRLASGMGGVAQHRAIIAFCRWPAFSLGVTRGVGTGMPFSTGRPLELARQDPLRASVTLSGLELQWRLARIEAIHPLFGVAFGRIGATWRYSLASPPPNVTRPSIDPRSSASWAAAAAGAEFNLFKYVRLDLMGGVRIMNSLATPGLAPRPLQGPFVSSTLALGKF